VAREFGLSLHAAHLHHGLRGAEADRDLEFVRRLCRGLGIPLIAARWRTPDRMKKRGLRGDAGLRTLRREFLRAAARRAGARAIATAHTADDQLETVLMRLLRGSGLQGLGGMRPRHGVWLKPLLGVTRRDLERDLRAAGQRWREDRSNRSAAHLRNRIRNIAIPALLGALEPTGSGSRHRSRGADARDRLARRVGDSARQIRDARLAIESRARAVIVRNARIGRNRVTISAHALSASPAAVERAALRQLWLRVAPRDEGMTHARLEALRALTRTARDGARLDLARDRTARIDDGRLVIGLGAAARAPGRAARRNGKLPRLGLA
jgi:tRNA(Ile)-lysidine synthase